VAVEYQYEYEPASIQCRTKTRAGQQREQDSKAKTRQSKMRQSKMRQSRRCEKANTPRYKLCRTRVEYNDKIGRLSIAIIINSTVNAVIT